MTSTPTVLVAGATGTLGSKIVHELLRRGAVVRALVRESNPDGAERLSAAADNAAFSVVTGDLGDALDVLAGKLHGVDVVVSAVQGGSEVVVDGQVNLLRAAESAGVARMIPSDFSVDLHKLDYGDNVNLDARKRMSEAFQTSSVLRTSVLNGGFIEIMLSPFMGIVDLEAATFSYWGDGEQPMDFTTMDDAAAYTAAAVLDDSAAGVDISVAGQVLTMSQLRAEIEQAVGRSLVVRQLGTIGELEAEIKRRKAGAKNVYEYVPLQYQWTMVTGKAKLTNLDNDRYPDITPTTVGEFLTRSAEAR